MRRAVLIDKVFNRPNRKTAKNYEQNKESYYAKIRRAEKIHKKRNYANKCLNFKINHSKYFARNYKTAIPNFVKIQFLF